MIQGITAIARFYGPHMRGFGMRWPGDGYYGYGFHPFAGIGILLAILVFGLVVYAIIRLARGHSKPELVGIHGRHMTVSDDATGRALAILKERFARGELSDADFERMKARLLDLPLPAAPTESVSEPPKESGARTQDS